MAGAAASESILFIGSILAAAALAGALGAVATELAGDLRSRSATLGSEMTGRIAIVNDPANVPTGPLLLYVKNVGGVELNLDLFVVLVDGAVATSWSATVDGAPASTLSPGALATLSVSGLSLGAGDHTARVLSDTNHAATLRFTV